MSKYPDIDNDDFYERINKKYSKYKIPKNKKTLKQICFPKKYEFQIPQKFLAEYINPKTPYKGLLVYHRIGAGKTCGAISIAENFKKSSRIMIVLPASLKGNFRTELRSQCAGNNYLTLTERKILSNLEPTNPAYKSIISKSDARIDKYYTIYSYNKFINLLKKNELDLENTLLIIDEVHNMVSETGTYYEELYNVIQSSPDSLRLVILTATPIFDKPIEIALTMNLLIRDRERQLPTGPEFVKLFMDIIPNKEGISYRVKNMDLFKNYVKGYVSYYRGAPPHVFPTSNLYISRTTMSDRQFKVYRKIEKSKTQNNKVDDYVNEDISNSFLIGTRMASNFIFPNGKMGEEGYESLSSEDFSMTNLREYSPKFLKIFRRIKKCQGTVFVYSNFKEFGGIRIFTRLLEYHGYKNYEFNGAGRKRYALWTGDTNPSLKEELKTVFNNKNNVEGEKIKIILGSSSIKEGVSLLRVQEVHIIEPYWNFSRMDQVIGRAIRFCSHKDVPEEKRHVNVYIYIAVYPGIKETVEMRIMKMAIDKRLINTAFEKALKEAAVDCMLFENANEDNIICDI